MPKIEMTEVTTLGNTFIEDCRSLPRLSPTEKTNKLLELSHTKTTRSNVRYNIGMWLAAEKHSALTHYLTLLSLLVDDADINPLDVIRLLSTRHGNGDTLFSLIAERRNEEGDDDDYVELFRQYTILLIKLAGKTTPVFFALCNSGLLCVPEYQYNLHTHFGRYKGEIRDYICNLPQQTVAERAFKIQTLKNARDVNHPLCQIFLISRDWRKCRMDRGSLRRLGEVLTQLESPARPSKMSGILGRLGVFSRWAVRAPVPADAIPARARVQR